MQRMDLYALQVAICSSDPNVGHVDEVAIAIA